MLKRLAVFYVVLAAIESCYRLGAAFELGAFSIVKPWFVWAVNIFGLVAVWAYATQRRLVPVVVWQIALAAFVAVRVIEVFHGDLFVASIPLQANALIGIQYLWYVLPSILCLCYWSFWKRSEHAL